MVTPRGLFITLHLLYVFAATELTTTVLSQSLPTERADTFDGAIESVRIVGEGSERIPSGKQLLDSFLTTESLRKTEFLFYKLMM